MNEPLKTALDQINECKSLEVRSIEVTAGYGLRLFVDELVPQKRFPENPERDFDPSVAAKIRAEINAEVIPEARRLEIVFEHYISATVTNECYGKYPSAPEAFVGNMFRQFSWSYLLELTRKLLTPGTIIRVPSPRNTTKSSDRTKFTM